jgi:hypothetical protein
LVRADRVPGSRRAPPCARPNLRRALVVDPLLKWPVRAGGLEAGG